MLDFQVAPSTLSFLVSEVYFNILQFMSFAYDTVTYSTKNFTIFKILSSLLSFTGLVSAL